MAYREIPEGSVEIQTGLWLYSYERVIGGNTYLFRQLFSSEGYCFYDKTEEIWREDENGNPYQVPEEDILPEERTYAQWASLGLITDVNNFVSVLVDDSYENVSRPNNSEVASVITS